MVSPLPQCICMPLPNDPVSGMNISVSSYVPMSALYGDGGLCLSQTAQQICMCFFSPSAPVLFCSSEFRGLWSPQELCSQAP